MNNTTIIFSDEAGQYYKKPNDKQIISDPFYVRSAVYLTTEEYITFQKDIITLKKKYNLLIGERTAEDIKIKIGSAYPTEETENATMEIKGRNLMDGLPKNVVISADEVREALEDSLQTIVEAIKNTLEKTPPELSADIIDHGIMLTGGGALLRGLDQLVSRETGMPVHVAERPLDCVVDGTGKRLEVTMPASYYKARRR